MVKRVEFFFDIVSPASYLAWTQIPMIAEETGAEIDYRPFFVPGLFKEAGNASPITVPAKGRWALNDFTLWAKKYGVPFAMNSRFPNSSVYAMRGLLAFQDTKYLIPLGEGFYQAMWVNNEDINDPEVVSKIAQNADLDPHDYQQAVADPKNKEALFQISKDLKDRGAFGAPTFFVGDQMFWGQDRLEFVKDALQASV